MSITKKSTYCVHTNTQMHSAQSAGAVEYTDCNSAEGRDNPPLHERPVYDIKQSESGTPVLEIWEMRNTSSLPLLPGPLRCRVVAPD